jgi:hypothetical protein
MKPRHVFNRLFLWIVVATAFAWSNPGRSFAFADAIGVDFSKTDLDRLLFRTIKSAGKGNWSFESGYLRASIPAGKTDRPPMRLSAQVRLEGDFTIEAGYSIAKLPRPKSGDGRNNLEISIATATGFVTLFRNVEVGPGDLYGYYIHKNSGDDLYERTPTTDSSGILRLSRKNGRLTFECGENWSDLRTIGEVEFDKSPITETALQVLPYQTTDALDVRFDRFTIKADRIVKLQDLNASGSTSVWKWVVAALFSLIGIGAIARGSRSKSERS